MYYLYIIESLLNGRKYIGSTENTEKRLHQHNNKQVRSTKAYAPWKLVFTEKYATKTEARKRELELKNNSWKRRDLYEKIK